MTAIPPAKVEVELMPLTLIKVEMEVEPVMDESPVICAPPADTVNCCPEVILPVEVMLLEEVIKPDDNPWIVEVPVTLSPALKVPPSAVRLPELLK